MPTGSLRDHRDKRQDLHQGRPRSVSGTWPGLVQASAAIIAETSNAACLPSTVFVSPSSLFLFRKLHIDGHNSLSNQHHTRSGDLRD